MITQGESGVPIYFQREDSEQRKNLSYLVFGTHFGAERGYDMKQ